MKGKINQYIKTWETNCYSNGIPDEVPARINELGKAPSYKAICMAILNNDYPLKSLGYYPKRSKYYDCLKRIELSARSNQPRLL